MSIIEMQWGETIMYIPFLSCNDLLTIYKAFKLNDKFNN